MISTRLTIALFVMCLPTVLMAGTSDQGPAPLFIDLPRTGQTTCYDSGGTEINCAGTGQDGEIQAGVPWPDPRFTNNADGTMTDKLTGLMWTQDGQVAAEDGNANCFQGNNCDFKTWQEALDYVAGMNAATNPSFGYTDWRLPNILELLSLSNHTISGLNGFTDWLAAQGFVNVYPSNNRNFYWSSTTALGFSPPGAIAWTFNVLAVSTFADGKTFARSVWPVRGGQQDLPDPQYPANIRKTGQTTCYDSGGTEINCTGTGQDGDIQAGVAWPDPRFRVNGDTVTDDLTGLVWKHDPTVGPMTWQEYLDYVSGLNNQVAPASPGEPADVVSAPNDSALLSILDFGHIQPLPPEYSVDEGLDGLRALGSNTSITLRPDHVVTINTFGARDTRKDAKDFSAWAVAGFQGGGGGSPEPDIFSTTFPVGASGPGIFTDIQVFNQFPEFTIFEAFHVDGIVHDSQTLLIDPNGVGTFTFSSMDVRTGQIGLPAVNGVPPIATSRITLPGSVPIGAPPSPPCENHLIIGQDDGERKTAFAISDQTGTDLNCDWTFALADGTISESGNFDLDGFEQNQMFVFEAADLTPAGENPYTLKIGCFEGSENPVPTRLATVVQGPGTNIVLNANNCLDAPVAGKVACGSTASIYENLSNNIRNVTVTTTTCGAASLKLINAEEAEIDSLMIDSGFGGLGWSVPAGGEIVLDCQLGQLQNSCSWNVKPE